MFTNLLEPFNENILKLINDPIVGIDILIDNNKLNLNEFNVSQCDYYVSYKKGTLNFSAFYSKDNFSFKLYFKALFNTKTKDLFSTKFTITPNSNCNCNFTFIPYLSKDIFHKDFKTICKDISSKGAYMCLLNNSDNNITTYAMKCEVFEGDFKKTYFNTADNKDDLLSYSLKAKSLAGSPVTINKYCCIIEGACGNEESLNKKALDLVKKSCIKGFDSNKR